jgi:alcohol dehydrogenase class IV
VTPGARVTAAHRPDLVVAIGGGSAIDTAKVLAVLAAAPDGVGVPDVLDTGSHRIDGAAELWAVPTISGTGAEVTRGTVVADAAGLKHGFSSRARHPRLALLDPDLALGIPARVLGPPTADLFCHAVEAFVTRAAFPVGDVLSATAITLLGGVIDEAGPERSAAATERAMLAAVLAAQAFSSGSGLTLAHEFSDVAGIPLGLPHGYAAALLLPAVLRRGAGTGADRVRRLGGLFAGLGWSGDPVADVVRALRRTGAPHLRQVCDPGTARALLHALYESGDPRHSVPHEEAVAVVETAFGADD